MTFILALMLLVSASPIPIRKCLEERRQNDMNSSRGTEIGALCQLFVFVITLRTFHTGTFHTAGLCGIMNVDIGMYIRRLYRYCISTQKTGHIHQQCENLCLQSRHLSLREPSPPPGQCPLTVLARLPVVPNLSPLNQLLRPQLNPTILQ